jgi:hypothetical protein
MTKKWERKISFSNDFFLSMPRSTWLSWLLILSASIESGAGMAVGVFVDLIIFTPTPTPSRWFFIPMFFNPTQTDKRIALFSQHASSSRGKYVNDDV